MIYGQSRGSIFNQKGQSIIELLIGVGISVIMAAVIGTLQILMARQNRALEERVTILELANRIPAVIADSTTCAKLFANTNLYSTASMPFDSGSITAKSPYLFAINSLYDNGLQPFADAGTYLRGTSHTVFVKKQTDNPPGLQIAITQMNPPMAFLYIHFDQTQLVHAVADIGFRILLKTTGTAAATRVTGCVGSRG